LSFNRNQLEVDEADELQPDIFPNPVVDVQQIFVIVVKPIGCGPQNIPGIRHPDQQHATICIEKRDNGFYTIFFLELQFQMESYWSIYYFLALGPNLTYRVDA